VVFLPSKPLRQCPNSFLTSSSCRPEKTGPSWQTRYLPMTHVPHMPMAQRMKRSRLASKGTWWFWAVRSILCIIFSGPQV